MKLDLKDIASEIGWQVAGVANPIVEDDMKHFFEEWLQTKKGPQLNYLERRKLERLEPQRYLPSVKSILCFGLYYFPGWPKGSVKVSNYSWADQDYHLVLKEKLEATVQLLESQLGAFEFKICVDTSPVLEKYWAKKAGLGWIGKNALLLNQIYGSYLFLGEIFSNIEPENFEKSGLSKDRCGNCRRCLDACPTSALETPYSLNAEECIAYWNLEHKGDFGPTTPQWSEWVAGCDICQEVCPWNQKLIPLRNGIDLSFASIEPEDLSSPDWPTRIKAKAVSYIPEKNWIRNKKWIRK